MNILITGAGGPLGQSILKAARQSELVDLIVGTDMQPMSVGLYKADRGYVVPGVRRGPQKYIANIKEICAEENVRAVLVGSEPELETLCHFRDSFHSELGVTVVASGEQILQTALDKFHTCEFLQHHGLLHPRYVLTSNWAGVEDLVAELGFPLIVKPRRGSGSQGLSRIRNYQDLHLIPKLYDAAVLQECLLPDDQEYTLGVFVCADGTPIDPIIMRRELAAGQTYRASVVRNDAIRNEALRVASALRPFGPCNIQMRLTGRGPVTFEINPRFSSTTSVRAHFGYNEVDMSLRNLVMGEAPKPPHIRSGHVMRYWEELYCDTPVVFSEKHEADEHGADRSASQSASGSCGGPVELQPGENTTKEQP